MSSVLWLWWNIWRLVYNLREKCTNCLSGPVCETMGWVRVSIKGGIHHDTISPAILSRHRGQRPIDTNTSTHTHTTNTHTHIHTCNCTLYNVQLHVYRVHTHWPICYCVAHCIVKIAHLSLPLSIGWVEGLSFLVCSSFVTLWWQPTKSPFLSDPGPIIVYPCQWLTN